MVIVRCVHAQVNGNETKEVLNEKSHIKKLTFGPKIFTTPKEGQF
jgi:hypothetical protein